MTDHLEYIRTYYAIADFTGGLKRHTEDGGPILYVTNAEAAKACERGETVIAVKCRWKQAVPPR